MLDIGWMEMLLVAMVALVVIGPKDLPRALRTAGQWVGKIKGVAREFQSSMDDMVRESELEELRENVKKASDGNFDEFVDFDHEIDPTGSRDGAFSDPTGLEGPPRRTAPPAEELLNSDPPDYPQGDFADEPQAVDATDPAEIEVAGERPTGEGSETARTGT